MAYAAGDKIFDHFPAFSARIYINTQQTGVKLSKVRARSSVKEKDSQRENREKRGEKQEFYVFLQSWRSKNARELSCPLGHQPQEFFHFIWRLFYWLFIYFFFSLEEYWAQSAPCYFFHFVSPCCRDCQMWSGDLGRHYVNARQLVCKLLIFFQIKRMGIFFF